MTSHSVTFVPSGRGKARCAPDPDYPRGKHVDASDGHLMVCRVTLPYPAPECGHFLVECEQCGLSAAVTAAGRPDDPLDVRVPCKSMEVELAVLKAGRSIVEVRMLMSKLRSQFVACLQVSDSLQHALRLNEEQRALFGKRIMKILGLAVPSER
jgi:hypothetical protein